MDHALTSSAKSMSKYSLQHSVKGNLLSNTNNTSNEGDHKSKIGNQLLDNDWKKSMSTSFIQPGETLNSKIVYITYVEDSNDIHWQKKKKDAVQNAAKLSLITITQIMRLCKIIMFPPL